MPKKTFIFFACLAMSFCINTVYAETKTGTFDFSVNSYRLTESASIGEITSKYIPIETKLENNGVTMTLAPKPFGISDEYVATWYKPYQALYYYSKSHFILTLKQSDCKINSVRITFADGMNGAGNHFVDSYITNNTVETYTLIDDIGTLNIETGTYSEICWWCKDKQKLQIKKIEVEYEYDPATSVIKTIAEEYKLTTDNEGIHVSGNYTSIAVYSISGSLISKDKADIICKPGIYIAKINGKAQKVIVK